MTQPVGPSPAMSQPAGQARPWHGGRVACVIAGGRRVTARGYCGSLVKAGKTILPVATLAGQTVTGLPFCHCTIRPVM